MNSKRVVVEDSGKEVGWACICGLFYSNKMFGGAEGSAKDAAGRCCEPKRCTRCGSTDVAPYITICRACANKEDADRWSREWDEKKKIKASDYDGEMVYRDGLSNDGYVGIDEAQEELSDNDLEPWAYATEPVKFRLDAEHVVENGLESAEFHDEAISEIGDADIALLQTVLDAWCKKVNVTSHFVDHNTIVLFDEGAND